MNTLTSLIQTIKVRDIKLSTEVLDADYAKSRIDSLDNRLSALKISSQPTEAEQVSILCAIISSFTQQ